MDLAGVLFLRRRVPDDGAQRNDGRFGGLGLRGEQGRVQLLDVFDVFAGLGPVNALGVPAVGLVALQDVLSKGDVGVVLDGDVVLIVDNNEVAQFLVTRQGGSLGGYAFLDVAVGRDNPDGVVKRGCALGGVGVEQAAHPALGVGETHGGGKALAQGAGGDFNTSGVLVLRVAGGQRIPGAQRLEVVQFQAVTGQEQLDVKGQRGVTG